MKSFLILQITLVFLAYFFLAIWFFDKSDYVSGINSLITSGYVLLVGISCLIILLRNDEILKLRNQIVNKDKEIENLKKLRGYR